MKILIVEDNADILANLYDFFEPRGHAIDSARSGAAGLLRAAEERYDVLVLDLLLPGIDGLEVCRRLRRELRQATPVLMLTARDTVQDKVAGFDCGADDYLVKPFSMVELEARLKALSRRASGGHAVGMMRCGPITFDPATFEAQREGRPLRLTPTGYKLLAALLRAAPQVVGREALERELWGDAPPDSDALRTHIHALRNAIDKPFEHPMLRTMPGIGFRLVDPDAT